ncbi:MAG TPA: hypothetical protein VIH43_02985, partial [Chthoniobacterales bacterium]
MPLETHFGRWTKVLVRCLLKGFGRHVPQCGMKAAAVVVFINERAAVNAEILDVPILMAVDFFLLERLQEAFASSALSGLICRGMPSW